MQDIRQQSPGARLDEELIGTLQYVFITQRKHDISKVANRLNMSYQDLYAYISGRRTMPITLLIRLTEVTRDPIFMDTVFSGTGLSWTFRKGQLVAIGEITEEAFEAFAVVGKIAEALQQSLKDGKLTKSEKTELRMRISAAQKELSDLLEAVATAKEN